MVPFAHCFSQFFSHLVTGVCYQRSLFFLWYENAVFLSPTGWLQLRPTDFLKTPPLPEATHLLFGFSPRNRQERDGLQSTISSISYELAYGSSNKKVFSSLLYLWTLLVLEILFLIIFSQHWFPGNLSPLAADGQFVNFWYPTTSVWGLGWI